MGSCKLLKARVPVPSNLINCAGEALFHMESRSGGHESSSCSTALGAYQTTPTAPTSVLFFRVFDDWGNLPFAQNGPHRLEKHRILARILHRGHTCLIGKWFRLKAIEESRKS